MKDWTQLEMGSVLFPFAEDGREALREHNNKRSYTKESSYGTSVAHWRVDKPVHNMDICINCFNCWVYCPDAAILVREEKMRGVDYQHCKGCGVCVSVCPTNPKSLLMFDNNESNDNALGNWPKKEPKKPASESN